MGRFHKNQLEVRLKGQEIHMVLSTIHLIGRKYGGIFLLMKFLCIDSEGLSMTTLMSFFPIMWMPNYDI